MYGFNAKIKAEHRLCLCGLAGQEPYPSSDPTWDTMLTHREKKKQPNYSFLCMHNKHGYPGLWLMHLICSSFWSSVAFGIQKDIGAAATFVWLTGQRRGAVPRQLSGASKLCTPCAIFHQVIMKTGTVASAGSLKCSRPPTQTRDWSNLWQWSLCKWIQPVK